MEKIGIKKGITQPLRAIPFIGGPCLAFVTKSRAENVAFSAPSILLRIVKIFFVKKFG